MSSIASPTRNAVSNALFWAACTSKMGLFQRPLGYVDFVLHQVQFCASLHRPLHLVGHQFRLDRLAGSSDLTLVVDDGSTQLTRISLSRAIFPFPCHFPRASPGGGHPFAGILSLTARVCCFSSSILRFSGTWVLYMLDNSGTPKPRVSLLLGILGVWHSGQMGNLGTHVQSRQQDSEVEETWQLRFESNDYERGGICCGDVCWVARCRPGISFVPNCVVPFQRLRILFVCGQVSSIVISLVVPRI